MLDQILIRQTVISKPRHIYLMRAFATAGETNIGLARLARAIHNAANDRNGNRLVDMLQPVLDDLHCLNHVELLARA